MRKLSDNVMLLGNGFFNYYVIGQENAALVECGTSAGAAIFARQWEELEKKPNIKYIVALHSHFDHICGVSVLKKLFPEAQLVGNPVAQKLLSKERIVKMLFYNDAMVSEAYVQNGYLDQKPEPFEGETIPVDLVVSEGDILQLGQALTIKIIDAPGHSPCSIAAYVEQDQVMMISDAAGFRSDENQISPVFFQDYDSYVATIQKLMKYPAKVIGVAHGDIYEGQAPREFYQQSLAAAEQAREFITTSLDNGISEEALAQEMFGRYIKGPLETYPIDMMLGSMHLLIKNAK
jgi:glyoxylase-like metal-dependent hydrolase (beta-lactamase superfamily II)